MLNIKEIESGNYHSVILFAKSYNPEEMNDSDIKSVFEILYAARVNSDVLVKYSQANPSKYSFNASEKVVLNSFLDDYDNFEKYKKIVQLQEKRDRVLKAINVVDGEIAKTEVVIATSTKNISKYKAEISDLKEEIQKNDQRKAIAVGRMRAMVFSQGEAGFVGSEAPTAEELQAVSAARKKSKEKGCVMM